MINNTLEVITCFKNKEKIEIVANKKVNLKDFGVVENWKKWSLWS